MSFDAALKAVLARLSDLPEWDDVEITNLDQADSSGDTPLHVFCWRSDAEAVLCLVSAGANINAVGDMGYTPLMVAAGGADVEIVRTLLDAGADRTLVNEFGTNAHQCALMAPAPASITVQQLKAVIDMLAPVPLKAKR